MGNNTFTIISFFYSLILNACFFAKKRIKNIETTLFSYIIVTNFVNILFALLSYSAEVYGVNPILNTFLAKGVIVCFYTFSYLFNLYVLSITTKNSNIGDFKNFGVVLFYILAGIPILFLPIHYYHEGNVIYSYGLCANYEYIVISIMIFAWFIMFIKNFDSLKQKKAIPIIIFVVLLVVVAVIQRINPQLLLLTSLETVVVYLMYFTIENPDVKMLAELNKSKEISDNANEEKTMFLYNMSQDIRSITSEIDDDADAILESKELDEIYDIARDVKAKSSSFTTLTNSVLGVSALEQSNIKILKNKYDLKILLKEIVSTYSKICKDKELNFVTNIDNNIPATLKGDNIGLKDVLTKILNNNISHTHSGYVGFDVSTIIKGNICRLIITIEDSGSGIKSDEINNIKLGDTELAKANKMITVMNGTMMISSVYGTGTKVKIILDQKIVDTDDSSIKKYESEFINIKVLAIDDKEAGIKIIEKVVKGTNITLESVLNGKDALERIKANKYDLILLDETLSQISGSELLVKIKEIRGFNTPVILLTKDNTVEYNDKYLEDGFSDYILKPVNKNKLLSIIDKYKKGN